MSHPDYSAAVWQYFKDGRHVGSWPAAEGAFSASANTPGSRAVLVLQAKVADERIADTRFQVYGCVSAIACGAWLAEWLVGKNHDEAAALDAAAVDAALALAPIKRHCALLAEDALKTLLVQWRPTGRASLKATG